MEPKVPEFGRFAEPSLLILVSLSDGPKHGYAIMQDIEQGTGRPMGAGTLYAALARLEEQGFIEPIRAHRSAAAVSPHGGRRVEPRGTAPRAFRVRRRRVCGNSARPSHEIDPDPLLPRPLAGPLRRRVRGGPRGTSARALRRRRYPPRPPSMPTSTCAASAPHPIDKGVSRCRFVSAAQPPSSAQSSSSTGFVVDVDRLDADGVEAFPGAALVLAGTALLLLALVGLSAFQARRHPRLIWAAFAVPAIGLTMIGVGIVGMAALGDRPFPGGVSPWNIWILGVFATVVGSGLFAIATYRTDALPRAGAGLLGAGSAVLLRSSCPRNGSRRRPRGHGSGRSSLVGLLAFTARWVALGWTAIRVDQPAAAARPA